MPAAEKDIDRRIRVVNGRNGTTCTACDGRGEVEGMSGNWKLCPRCRKDEIKARREAKWLQPNWHRAVFEHSQAIGLARMVLWVLAYDADKFGRVSMPRAEIASKCATRPNSVKVALKWLVENNELRREREGIGKATAVYRILLPARTEPRRPKHQPDVPGF